MESEGASPDTQLLRDIFFDHTGEDFIEAGGQTPNDASKAATYGPQNFFFCDGEGESQESLTSLTGACNPNPRLLLSLGYSDDVSDRNPILERGNSTDRGNHPIESLAANGIEPETQHTHRCADSSGKHFVLSNSEPSTPFEPKTTPHGEELRFLRASQPLPLPHTGSKFLPLNTSRFRPRVEVVEEAQLQLPIQREVHHFSPLRIPEFPSKKKTNMENFSSPLHGSDHSYQSTTQENDPSTYKRYPQSGSDAPRSQPRFESSRTSQPHNGSCRYNTNDASHSYHIGDADHLTLDYDMPRNPVPGHHGDDTHKTGLDEQIEGEEQVQGKSQDVDVGPYHNSLFADPITPAPKVLFKNPGSLMRPSQLFAATQPSTGFRGIHREIPTSSRPSPGLYNDQTTIKNPASSPLLSRVQGQHSSVSVMQDFVSSPFVSSHVNSLSKLYADVSSPSVKRTPAPKSRQKSTLMNDSPYRNVPEPHRRYMSRKESQERRIRATMSNDDSSSEDDEFTDHEATRYRLAKVKKDEATKALDNVKALRRPKSSESDVIEVPSTSNRRRRSMQGDYVAQCSVQDVRETQEAVQQGSHPDIIIVDSQVMQIATTIASDEEIEVTQDNLTVRNPQFTGSAQDESMSSSNDDSVELLHKLPALEAPTASDTSTTDRETFESSRKAPATQALSEVSGNKTDISTPSVHKSLPLSGDCGIIPETSPPEAHQRRYIGLENASQAIISSHQSDEIFNPLSQDQEFDAVINPPSLPGGPKWSNRQKNADELSIMGSKNKSGDVSTINNISAAPDTSSRFGNVNSETSFAAVEGASSDYVTAPNTLAIADSSLPVLQELFLREQTHSSVKGDIDHGTITVDIKEQPHKLRSRNEMKGPSRLLRGRANDIRDDLVVEKDNDKSLMMGDSPRRPHNLRSKEMVKGSSSLLRGSGQVPATPSTKIAPIQKAPPLTAKIPSRSSSRRSVGNKTSPSLTSPSKKVLVDQKANSNTHNSSRPESLVHKPSPSLHSASRLTTIDPLELKPENKKNTIVSRYRKPGSAVGLDSGIFDGMAFSVSYVARNDEKLRVVRLIEKNGGRLLETGFDELFNDLTLGSNTDGVVAEGGLVINSKASDVRFTCLIADEHSRKAKYMQALALGIPCISGKWIEHCIAQNSILEWGPYMLAAGESAFLGGAIRSRSLLSYPAVTACFREVFASRDLLLVGKSILLVIGKARKDEERKMTYLFLTQALGAQRVKRVISNQEARKTLLEANGNGEVWDLVYVDVKEEEAEKSIFGVEAIPHRKRKRSMDAENFDGEPPKRVRIIGDEVLVQSLILGKLLEE